MKEILIKDEMGFRCRMQTKAGKRCKKTVQWLIPMISSRQSWLEAIKSGWPRMVRGMKQPDYCDIGLCRQHGNRSLKLRGYYIYGIGRVEQPLLDQEYEKARMIGQSK